MAPTANDLHPQDIEPGQRAAAVAPIGPSVEAQAELLREILEELRLIRLTLADDTNHD